MARILRYLFTVRRITSIRMLIAIAVLHNLDIHQMNVKIVFLNGELNEEIYIATRRLYSQEPRK